MLRPVDKRRKKKQKKFSFTDWLNSIEQDSWQLELIVSGVVVYLLIESYAPLQELGRLTMINALSGHTADVFNLMIVVALSSATLFLTAGFLCHLVLRSFWIGAVGLRSVSGDFDFGVLNYQKKYEQWLKGRLGSFDEYIQLLEVRSSIAFSMGFLMAFIAISACLYLIFLAAGMAALAFFAKLHESFHLVGRGVVVVFQFAYVICGVLYAIDFFSLGALKKVRWLRFLYYPIYRVMGWVTLARFYRPFYYNLIDHPFGRKLIKWLLPTLLGFILLSVLVVGRNLYMPGEQATKNQVVASHYLTTEIEDVKYDAPSLATYYPKDDYLEVFIPYIGREVDKVIDYQFPDIEPSVTRSFGIDDLYDVRDQDDPREDLLMVLRQIHLLKLNDSLLVDVPWKFYNHPVRQQPGLVYGLPIYDLPRGEHCLTFERLRYDRSSGDVDWDDLGTLCFLR